MHINGSSSSFTAARTALPEIDTLSGLGPGTLISTTDGDLPVEWLAEGDRVLTRGQGAQPLRRIGRSRVSARHLAADPARHPVRLAPGSMGGHAPDHPLTLAPQHRIHVSGPDLEYYFGRHAAFAPAQCFAAPAATSATDPDITYFHLLFDDHQVIRANGMWVESLFCPPGTGLADRGTGLYPRPKARHHRTAHYCLNTAEATVLHHVRQAARAADRRRAA